MVIADRIAKAKQRYRLDAWSAGYFDILKDGALAACLPADDGTTTIISLPEVAAAAMAQGLNLPLLVRFPAILSDRVRTLEAAFASAIAAGARQQYLPLYPVKANQQRCVVETVLRSSQTCGLEVGSKAELLLALALCSPDNPIVCNGCKDYDMLSLALIGSNMGLRVFIIIESIDELQHTLELARSMDVLPVLGLRLRLRAVAEGNWQSSGGYKSKFGLGPMELLDAIAMLRRTNMLACLQLLHFHAGSQIPDISAFRDSIKEACRYYADLYNKGAPLQYLNVGGGLAVDYDGTSTAGLCSANYDINQYAEAVVHGIQSACSAARVPLPTIVTECGRALTAHHAMVITSVTRVEAPSQKITSGFAAEQHSPEFNELAQRLADVPTDISVASRLHEEIKHHWQQTGCRFDVGEDNLEALAAAERLYRISCAMVARIMRRLEITPPAEMTHLMSARLLCNFSVFQTLPDAWALDHVFPVLPLHGFDSDRQVDVILHDLTCDSDGCLRCYVGSDGDGSSLALPVVANEQWPLLGFFLLGAYQEVLGDVHNLFGNESVVSVLPEDGGCRLVDIAHGDTVADLLSMLQFEPQQLLQKYLARIEVAGIDGDKQSKCMEVLRRGLAGSTYMQTPPFPDVPRFYKEG